MKILRIAALAFLTLAPAFLPCASAQPVPPGDFRLGPAPWLEPGLPPAPPAFGPKAVSPVPAIDTASRSAVVAAYNTYFNVTRPGLGFTGSSATCTPGAISLAFQEWTITRINFMRAMAGVPGNTTLNASVNAQQQAAALIMAAQGALSHFPESTWACWTQAGYDGASSSNLAMGTSGFYVDFMPLYMTDQGTGNEMVGHRRWILHSAKASFGLGQAIGPTYAANALYVFGPTTSVSVPDGIPWPPRGYVPLALFPAPSGSSEGARWSFGLPAANFAGANVSMTLNGAPLAVTVISRTANGYGDNTIVWSLPAGHAVTKESTYAVSITGVANAASTSYSYDVVPIDPADPLPTIALTVAKAGTGYGTVTSVPAGINCGDDCTQAYNVGQGVELTATPAAGSLFSGWGGACTGGGVVGPVCSVTMDAAKSATAVFTIDPSQDADGDGIPDGVEPVEGRNPVVKDNDVFSPGAASARLFAMQQYRDFLGREGDPAGIQGWTDLVVAGAYSRPQVINAFLQSAEFGGFVAPVVRLYFATFLRVPDYDGLTFNAGLVRNGALTLAQLADFFAASPEFAATYGALDNTNFVGRLYNNVLQRIPEPAGLAGWVALLESGYTRGQVLLGFSESAEYKVRMAEEVLVTMMYAGMLRRTPEPAGYNGWVQYLDTYYYGGDYIREQVINGFFLSTEYRARFLP